MVRHVFSLTNHGLRDYMVQRVTAVILAVYILYILGFILFADPFDYAAWSALFAHDYMRVATIVMLLSLILHAWVGMWTVFTDYVKSTILQIILMSAMIVSLVAYLVWGIFIVWGV